MFGILESVHVHPGPSRTPSDLSGSEWLTLLQQPSAAYSDAAHIKV
jgi:hypothetical protein